MNPIKLIIFDFGDVIGHFDINHFNKFIEQNGGYSKEIGNYFKQNKAAFDTGDTSEEEFWTNLGVTTQINLHWKKIAENNQKNLIIDYRMIDLIKRINLKKIILSNMDITTTEQIRKELKLKEIFDESLFSFELGANKLNENILKNICEKYQVDPKEVLFIDDFKGNIEQAKEFGFQTVLFEKFEQFSYLIKDLI